MALHGIIRFLARNDSFLEDALRSGLNDAHIRFYFSDFAVTVRTVGVVHTLSGCDEVRLFDDD